MHTIDEAVAAADHEWRACGVRRADRAALAADLRLDLESAAADGIAPAQLLGVDVRGFARRLAEEAGVRRAPRGYLRVVVTALVGAVLGAALSAFIPSLVLGLFDLTQSGHLPLAPALVSYGSAAAIVIAGAVAAVRIHLRDLPYVRATARAMSVLLPVVAIVITPTTMGLVHATGYSTALPVVATEIALIIAAFAGAIVLARHWSLRGPAAQ